jgi:hypothetical protein
MNGLNKICETIYELKPQFLNPLGIMRYLDMPFKEKLENIVQVKCDTVKNYQYICGKNQDDVNFYDMCIKDEKYELDLCHECKNFHCVTQNMPLSYIGNAKLTEITDKETNKTFTEIVRLDSNKNIVYKFCTEYMKLGTIHYDNYNDWTRECCRFMNYDHGLFFSGYSRFIKNKPKCIVEIKGNDTYYSREEKDKHHIFKEICEIKNGMKIITCVYVLNEKNHVISKQTYNTDTNKLEYVENYDSVNDIIMSTEAYIYDLKTDNILKKITKVYDEGLCKSVHETLYYYSKHGKTEYSRYRDHTLEHETLSCLDERKRTEYSCYRECVNGNSKYYQKIVYMDGNGKVLKLKYGIASDTKTNIRFELDKNSKLIVDVSNVHGEEHLLIGYKICTIPETRQQCVVKLGILPNSLVSNGDGIQDYKMRCDHARVLAVATIDNNRYNFYNYHAVSLHDPHFEYVLGHIVSVPDFDMNLASVCTAGIHFYLEESNALKFYASIDHEMENRDALVNINCHETIEYMIMLKSTIDRLEDNYIMKQAKKKWIEDVSAIVTKK